jgi:4-carboxymuconolactone decarboxylase
VPEETEALLELSAAIGTRSRERIASAIRRAAAASLPARVEEVLLQAHLFVGFPDALEALTEWRAVSGAPAPSSPATDGEASWERRGEDVCATVYGDNYRKLRHNVTALHPDFDRWMVVGGYGRVIGRPGLDLVTRELAIVALLVTWGAPRQLHSHLRGALNAGASPGFVERTLELACMMAEPSHAREARELWARIRK